MKLPLRFQKHIEPLLTKASLPQAVLIVDGGSGLSNEVAHTIIQNRPFEVVPLAPISAGDSATQSHISVANIRELTVQLRTQAVHPRIVHISSSEAMTISAQNAFLKLLEEPPAATHFLLTAKDTTLLPTILSRLQRLQLSPLTHEEIQTVLNEHAVTDKVKRQQLQLLSRGNAYELDKLLTDDAYFQKQRRYAQDAKLLISGTLYEQLACVQRYAKLDREATRQLLTIYDALLTSLVKTRPEAVSPQISRLSGAMRHLEINGNLRLALLQGVV